jgi:hypothetical protein
MSRLDLPMLGQDRKDHPPLNMIRTRAVELT